MFYKRIYIALLLIVPVTYYCHLHSIDNQDKEKIFHYSDTVYLNYVEKGRGAIPIIFLHGFGESLKSWYDLIPHFDTREYKLFLIDLKGFGRSSTVQDGMYGIADQSAIIIKFIEKKKLRSVILIGHSYGGGVALFTQTLMQQKKNPPIEKLILIDSAAYNEDIPFFIKQLRIPVINKFILNITSKRFRAKYILNRIVFDQKKISPKLINRYTESFSGKGKNYTFIKAAKMIVPGNYERSILQYKQIKIPCLIIWGANDSIISPKLAIRLNKDLPNSQLKLIDQCGHIPHQEYPERTFHLIEDFLNQK